MSPFSSHQDDEGEEMQEDMLEVTLETTRTGTEGGRKKRKPKRRKVFDESEMTEAERRELRRSQRDLHAQIDASSSAEDIEKLRLANNTNFSKVCYTREAVLDADNTLLIASKLVQQAERQVQVPTYDPLKLMQKLSNKCSSKDVDGGFLWKDLGRQCGICFNAVPERVSFMAGPLDAELPEKKTKPRQRKPREDMEKVVEVELKQVKDQEIDEGDKADRLSACEKSMKDMKHILKKNYKLKKSTHKTAQADICGLQFLVNPKSFTQTVENIFNFSFLIKKGEATIGVRETPGLGEAKGLYLAPRSNSEKHIESKQSVLSFTMRDWYRLREAYNITEGDLPHRSTKIQRRQVDTT